MARANLNIIGFATCYQYRGLTADDLVLAMALEKRGLSVVPVVWTATDPEAVSCDLLVVRSVWDYHLRPHNFMRWVDSVSSRMPALNPPEMIRWNMDKRYLQEIEAAGFAVPRTVFLQEGTEVDLAEMTHRTGCTQVVVKPLISASAYETRRIADPTQENNQWLNAMLKDRSMMVQEFIPEIQADGEWSLIFAGEELTHAVHKVPKPGDFRVQEEHGGLHKLAAPPQDALAMARKILRQFAPDAVYCRVDMVMRKGRATLMELELIEPLLHFELAPESAEVMAEKLAKAYH